MGGCCGSRPVSASLQQVQGVLEEIPSVYPGTKVTCVIHEDGSVVAKHTAEAVSDEDLLSLVCNVKSTALQFAAVLNQQSCPRIHIKGTSSLFSCYDVGSHHVLAFFTDMHGTRMDSFDVGQADKRMSPLLRRMQHALELEEMSASPSPQSGASKQK